MALQLGLFFTIVFFMQGCTTALMGTYGEDHQTLAAFQARVEQVFQLQNHLTSYLMLNENAESEITNRAEQQMQEACASLNEYAARESDGLSVDMSLKRRIEKTAIRCEKAAFELQRILSSGN
jgi:hypothetical protein